MTNLSSLPHLTVRAVRSTPVEVPPNFVLGTSMGAFRQVPLLLIDLETEEGVTGRSYLFGYFRAALPAVSSLVDEVARVAKGNSVKPAELWAKLAQRFTLIGVQGIVRMAMAGFDTACWDALAIASGVPLVKLLGAEPRPIPAYNSCGLGLMNDRGTLADEAEKLLAGGFRAIKLRLGYPTLAQDIAAVHAVRKRIGNGVKLMVDYNQALSVEEALTRGRALDAEDIYWLEEPIRHDDYAGSAKLARELKVPILIGGVTGWREAAAIAQSRNVKMSSHLFPEVSAHLLAATPTCHFLEYVDWADVLVEEPLTIVDGHAVAPSRPGGGMVWDKSAVARYRV